MTLRHVDSFATLWRNTKEVTSSISLYELQPDARHTQPKFVQQAERFAETLVEVQIFGFFSFLRVDQANSGRSQHPHTWLLWVEGYPSTGCYLIFSPTAALLRRRLLLLSAASGGGAVGPIPKNHHTSETQRSTMVHPSPSLLVVLDPGLDMVNKCVSPAFHTARLSSLALLACN